MKFTAQTIGRYFDIELEQLRKHIEDTYDIKIFHSLTNPLKGDVNINFAFESSAGKKIVRIFGVKNDFTEFELRVMDYLVANNFRTAKPRLNNSNSFMSQFEDYEYTIFDFLEGSAPNYLPKTFYRIGKSIAELNQLLRSYPEKTTRKNHWLEIYNRKNQLLQFCEDNNNITKKIISPLEYEAVQKQLDIFSKVEFPITDSIQLVHGDLYNPNIIDNGEQIAIIDFEYVANGPRIIDTVLYLAWEGVCNSRAVNTPTVFSSNPYLMKDQMQAYLKGYKESTPEFHLNFEDVFNSLLYLNVADTVFNLEKALKAEKNLYNGYINNFNNAKIFQENGEEVKKLFESIY